MVIIKVMGGLGNQLYQYALYEQFVQRGKDVYLDFSWYCEGGNRPMELDYFPNIKYRECSSEQRECLIKKKRNIIDLLCGKRCGLVHQPLMYSENIYSLDEVYLDGYWGEVEYWMPVIDILKQRLNFPASSDERNIWALEKIKETNAVSLHIRRGDYLDEKLKKIFGGICTEDYYVAALNYVKEKIKDIHLFVFSDDSEYIRSRFVGEDITIVDWNTNENSIYDMMLMSYCKVNICANSTFSKWAAILNKNSNCLRIIPLRHNKTQQVEPDTVLKQLAGWTVIDEQGNIYER